MSRDADAYIVAIRNSGLSIYDPIPVGHPDLWIPTPQLEQLLNEALRGVSLEGLPLRTRSKVVKEHVCRALGYPIPKSFKKTQPRFPGQCFDTYTQKANNLQIWNEELEPTRRYALIRVTADHLVARVRVVTGEMLADLDTTGTLTQKYQARLATTDATDELVVAEDTDLMKPLLGSTAELAARSPIDEPQHGELLPIAALFAQLRPLVGTSFSDLGHDQERNRGAALHELVCERLGYADYGDTGQFPDVRHQLLEVKLQTSPTIDLGLVCPDSTEPLDVPQLSGRQLRHCDVRYGVFAAELDGGNVRLTGFFLTTGEAFFSRFKRFEGKVLNKKIQIPLPADFFSG